MYSFSRLLVTILAIVSIESKLLLKNEFFIEKFNNKFFGDVGDPLILTDLIKENKIKEAQEAAKVNSSYFLGVKSYAGYFRVDDLHDSNLFFWFFPSENNFEKDPVILWLQGGPGAPSEYGLFQENGPLQFQSNGNLTLRPTSWTKFSSVIYIDQPVGTGFSYTGTGSGYARNQTKVGDDLYKAIYQFYQLFPSLQSNDFYITGESYAGKYIPALGYAILKKNPFDKVKIPLQGMAICDGLTEPKIQLRYAEYLYQHGLVDITTKIKMDDIENRLVENIEKEEWYQAFDLWTEDLNLNLGGVSIYNYVNSTPDYSAYTYELFQRENIRRTIHVGNIVYNNGPVYDLLTPDIPQSVSHLVAELLDHYRILVYNGQLDIIVAYPMTVNYLQNLQFSGAEEYKKAKRRNWYVNNDLAGYIKTAGNLTEVMVRNAGHMVPADQPEWAMDLIKRFIKNDLINT